MPINDSISLPIGDDLDHGITQLLTDSSRLMGAEESSLMRQACRGFTAHGVDRAVVAFHARYGDKHIDGTTCWNREHMVAQASWSQAPNAATDLPEIITTAVDNCKRPVNPGRQSAAVVR